MVQCEVDRRAEETAGVTQVMPATSVHDHMHRVSFLDEQTDSVSQLKFTTGTGLDATEGVEDRPIQ